MNLVEIGNNNLDILKEPFAKNCIKRISVSYRISFNGKWISSGTVEFKNGKTEGVQNFECDTFDQCVLEIKAFINSLK